jgi:hypothetical protein
LDKCNLEENSNWVQTLTWFYIFLKKMKGFLEPWLFCQWTNDDGTMCFSQFPNGETLFKHLVDDHIGSKVKSNLRLQCKWTEKCGMCNKEVEKRDHIVSHVRVHVPQYKPFLCKFCFKGFSRSHDLTKHYRSHKNTENELIENNVVLDKQDKQPNNNLNNILTRGRKRKPDIIDEVIEDFCKTYKKHARQYGHEIALKLDKAVNNITESEDCTSPIIFDDDSMSSSSPVVNLGSESLRGCSAIDLNDLTEFFLDIHDDMFTSEFLPKKNGSIGSTGTNSLVYPTLGNIEFLCNQKSQNVSLKSMDLVDFDLDSSLSFFDKPKGIATSSQMEKVEIIRANGGRYPRRVSADAILTPGKHKGLDSNELLPDIPEDEQHKLIKANKCAVSLPLSTTQEKIRVAKFHTLGTKKDHLDILGIIIDRLQEESKVVLLR